MPCRLNITTNIIIIDRQYHYEVPTKFLKLSRAFAQPRTRAHSRSQNKVSTGELEVEVEGGELIELTDEEGVSEGG